MNEIEAFREEWKNGDRAVAKQMAKDHVEAHRDAFVSRYSEIDREEIPALVDTYRRAGNHDAVTRIDMWILSEFEQKKIGGRGNIGGNPQ